MEDKESCRACVQAEGKIRTWITLKRPKLILFTDMDYKAFSLANAKERTIF